MNRVNPSKSPFENNNAKTEDFICATCAKMFHFSTQCEYLLFPLSLHSFTYANAMLGILHKKPSVKTLFMLNILLLLLQVHTFTVNPYLLCNLCKKCFTSVHNVSTCYFHCLWFFICCISAYIDCQTLLRNLPK